MPRGYNLQQATGSEPMLAVLGATDHCLSPQGKGYRMTPACPLLLSVILSLRLAAAFDPAPAPAPPWPQACCTGPSHYWTSFLPCAWAAPGPWKTRADQVLPLPALAARVQVCTHLSPSPAAPGPLPGQLYLPAAQPRGGRGQSGVGAGAARGGEGGGKPPNLELCGGSWPLHLPALRQELRAAVPVG